jgi:hypothetical protein
MSFFNFAHLYSGQYAEAAEQDGGPGDGEGEKKTAGVIHKGAYNRPNGEAKVKGRVTPGLNKLISMSEA